MSGFALRGFIALLAVGSCAAAALWAGKADKPTGKGPPSPEAIFKRLDADGDGRVTEAEYVSRTRWPEAKARAIWRASDADGDGKVTELEYCENRRVTDEAKKIFAWLDANKDAKLTEAEAVAGAKRIFAEMDADASGGVDIPEYLGARWRWQVDIRWAAKPRERTK